MKIDSLEDVKNAFQETQYNYVGVGITAFMRIIPAFFIENYSIIAYKCSKDIADIKRYAPVVCVEPALEIPETEDLNALSILQGSWVQDVLAEKGDKICIIIYQSYPALEALGRQHGWKVIGSPAHIRQKIENKKIFRDILSQLGLPRIPGEVISIDALNKATYREMIKQYGPRMVFQLPEVTRGGGRGTFFIDSGYDFESFRELLVSKTYRGYRVETVIVTQRRLGTPASIAACLTRYGTLVSSLQTQLLDISDVLTPTIGNGFFCGHDWDSFVYSQEVNTKARAIAETLGSYFWRLGYRGIFGIDFIVEEGQEIFPVECNARYTGVFPMLSLLYLKEGLIPMDAFHILELSGIDYEIDVNELNTSYQRELQGSHIILFNRYNLPGKVNGNLKSGLYRSHPENRQIQFLGAGMSYQDLQSESDFILTDGVPSSGTRILSRDELERICRVLFSLPIADTPTRLKKRSKEIIQWIYDQLHISLEDGAHAIRG